MKINETWRCRTGAYWRVIHVGVVPDQALTDTSCGAAVRRYAGLKCVQTSTTYKSKGQLRIVELNRKRGGGFPTGWEQPPRHPASTPDNILPGWHAAEIAAEKYAAAEHTHGLDTDDFLGGPHTT